MKILIINHFPLTGSGSGVYVQNIINSLKKKNHEISVIMPSNSKSYLEIDGVNMHPVYFKKDEEIENSLPFNFPCFTTHPYSTQSFYDLDDYQISLYKEAFKTAIEEEIKNFKPDVIHSQHIWTLSALVASYDIPLIVTAHGTDIIGYKKDTRFKGDVNKVLNESSYIITVSKDNYNLINNLFNVKDKSILIKNGYNSDVFYPEKYDKKEVLKELGINKNYDKVVSFVGKLTHIKGVDTLLKAASIYEKEEILTLVAGDGELRDELMKLKEKLNLKNVIFLGNVNHDTLRKIYNIADVSIVTSRKEAFGLVAVEALACSVPVISTNVGGLKEIINDKVGIKIEVDDYHLLAHHITNILDGKIRFDREYIGKYAKENYCEDKMIDKLIETYNNSINKKSLHK